MMLYSLGNSHDQLWNKDLFYLVMNIYHFKVKYNNMVNLLSFCQIRFVWIVVV